MINKHTTLFFGFLFCCSISIWGQPIRGYQPEVMIQTAEEQLAKGDYYNALDWYEQYYNATKERQIALNIAELHYQLRDMQKAESWYLRAINAPTRKGKKTVEVPRDARFRYARVLKMNEKYLEASEVLKELLTSAPNDSLTRLMNSELQGIGLVKSLPQPPTRLSVAPIEGKINTVNSEYSPFWAADGGLYFSAYRVIEPIELKSNNTDFHAKIYRSRLNNNGRWAEPDTLSATVNGSPYEHTGVCLSANALTMYYTEMSLKGNDAVISRLMVAQKVDNQWQAAQAVVGIECQGCINKQPNLGIFNGREGLFFVSNRKGGLGGFDLFFAPKIDETVFGEPLHLGERVNTVGDEETPFYHNGKLYFSSTGWAGLGGFDIFETTFEKGTWATPRNMGKGYNTALDDQSFSIDIEKGKGFLTSNREGTRSLKSKTCCDDIFAVEIEPLKINLLAKAFEGSKQLAGVTFILSDPLQSYDGTSTEYQKELALNIDYRLVAKKEGFYPDSLTFNTRNIGESSTIEKRLNLKAIPPPPPPVVAVPTVVVAPPPPPKKEPKIITVKRNEPIRLNNIYYAYDKADILPESEGDLIKILNLMSKYPDLVIEMGSHSDSRGKDDYNLRLSQKRAESAKNWLINRGVANSRVVPKGYGETQLLNQCKNGVKCSDDEHQTNRRTEFKILSGPTSIEIEETSVIQGN